MVRSSWVGALVGVLACAVAVQAQGKPAEQFITVREADKPAQKCRVLKSWKDKQGDQFLQVQAVDTGEIMTLREPTCGAVKPAQGGPKSTLFRWGSCCTPPRGTPAAPPNAVVLAPPKPACKPSLWDRLFGSSEPRVCQATVQCVPAPSCSCPAGPVGTVTPALPATSEPPRDARADVARPDGWRGAWDRVPPCKGENKLQPAPAPALAPVPAGPALPGRPAVLPPPPPPARPPAPVPVACSDGKAAPRCCEPPARTAPPCPVACGDCKCPPKSLPPTSSLFARWFQGKPAKPDATCSVCPKDGKCPKCGCDTQCARRDTVPRCPKCGCDYRCPKCDREPVAVKSEPVKVEAPPAQKKAEPKPASGRPARLPLLTQTREPPSSPKNDDQSGLWARLTSRSTRPKPAVQTVSAAPTAGPGTGPLAGASVPPAPRPAPAQEAGSLRAAANAFTVAVPPPGSDPASPGIPGQEVPDGMGNAFTKPGTTRPIPSDMGRSYQIPNAFPTVNQPVMVPYPVVPAGYVPHPGYAMMPGPAGVVPAAQPWQPSGIHSAHLLTLLRASLLPSEREMAAEQLSRCDWRYDPNVVTGLVQAAHMDPAPAVRACCVRALGRMKVNTVPVVTAVMALKSDRDIRVRQEVEQALAVMTAP